MQYEDEILVYTTLTLKSGDRANRTQILESGSLIVESGAFAGSTVIRVENSIFEDELCVSGTAEGVDDQGGVIQVLDGGAVYDVTLSCNGILCIQSGGSAERVEVGSAALVVVFAGNSSVTGIAVKEGGVLQLESGAEISGLIVFDGGIFGYGFHCSVFQNGESIVDSHESVHYTVRYGMTQVVEDGYVSKGATVQNGGTLRILSGGTAEDPVVERDGKLIVESGGAARNILLDNAKNLSYDFGTVVTARTSGKDDTSVRIDSTPESSWNYAVSGRQKVFEQYIAFEGSILSGGVQNIHAGGEASYIRILKNGVQNVLSDGRANVSRVFGEMFVESGGICNYTENYGTLTIRSGGIANNLSIFYGGTATVESGAELNGIVTISGELRVTGSISVSGELNFCLVEENFGKPFQPDFISAPLLNDITHVSGSSFSVTIASLSAVAGEYRLAGNAADFSGSMTVMGTDHQVYAVLDLTGDRVLERNGWRYELALNPLDEMVLRVEALPEGADTQAPLRLHNTDATVYADSAVTLFWDPGVDNVGVSGYEIRFVPAGGDLESAAISFEEEEQFFLSELESGSYEWQVRAVDAAGNRGAWSGTKTFRITSAGEDAVPDRSLVTGLWGHEYLLERYNAPEPTWSNDVSGCYFADAEKLSSPQDLLYCWGATTANILTWSGWAANSPYAFADEDETFEYFIDYWKNEGGLEEDALTWFFNGTGTGTGISVPVEGGNLFPQLDVYDYIVTGKVAKETDTLLYTLMDCFNAGYGVGYAIYSDSGLAHAISGWGYEIDDSGNTWLWYSDSDSDFWAGSTDRRDAVNRLSKTRVELGEDGMLYLQDYMIPGAYLGSFSAIRQFDGIMLGRHEEFQDARVLEFDGTTALRGGNLDGEDDDDYYTFTLDAAYQVEISVMMAVADPVTAGFSMALYDAGKELLYSSNGFSRSGSFTFDGNAGVPYYLLVEGSSYGSGEKTAPTIDTYFVQVALGPDTAAWREAGISSADDLWISVIGAEEYSRIIPGTEAVSEPQDLFAVSFGEPDAEATTANWIGPEDRNDMRMLEVETSGRFSLMFSEVDSQVRFTVWKLNGNKLKSVKRIIVGPKTKEEKRVVSNLLLDAGRVYFVEAESRSKTGTFYEGTISGEVFVKAENGDDTEAAVFSCPEYRVATEKSSGAAETVALSLFGENWIGYNDHVDFRSLELADAGRYTFSVSKLEKKAAGKLTLWRIREDGRLKKIFSMSGSSSKVREKNCLLERGDYLVSFESKSWKNGNNTDYTVVLSGTVYGRADASNDDWRNAGVMEEGAVAEEWVGFSDLQDWRRFTVETDSLCRLELSGVTENSASVALYRQNSGKDGEKNPSKLVSAKTKAGSAAIEEFLTAGTYYIAVKAEGKAKKSGTAYGLALRLGPAVQQGMLA